MDCLHQNLKIKFSGKKFYKIIRKSRNFAASEETRELTERCRCLHLDVSF